MYITYQLIIEIAIALLLVFSILAVIFAARRCITARIPISEESELFTLITAAGGGGDLEQTVKGLLMLDDSGQLKSRIVIADCGLECEARRAAELLAVDSDRVTVCTPRELPIVLEESGWSKTVNL